MKVQVVYVVRWPNDHARIGVFATLRGAMTFDDTHQPSHWRAVGEEFWQCTDATITACDVIPDTNVLDVPFVLDANELWSALTSEEAPDHD